MSRKLSVTHLTAIDLAPPALIRSAGEAALDGVRLYRSARRTRARAFSRDELIETRHELRDTGPEVAAIEFLRLPPNLIWLRTLPFLDTGTELGARQVIAAPYKNDPSR